MSKSQIDPMVLINVFELTGGDIEELVADWQVALDVMRNMSGFISSTLHRSVDGNAKFQLINVAHWESAEDFQAAFADPEFLSISGKMLASDRYSFTPHPSIYRRALTTEIQG
ncbi:antibiotic biosynthesis monooxygenase family protein [Nocardia sp. NPDC004415]